MLEQLLALLVEEQVWTQAGLARRLGVSPALVEQMLAHLARRGYLLPVEACASERCGSCGAAATCGGKGRGWVRLR